MVHGVGAGVALGPETFDPPSSIALSSSVEKPLTWTSFQKPFQSNKAAELGFKCLPQNLKP